MNERLLLVAMRPLDCGSPVLPIPESGATALARDEDGTLRLVPWGELGEGERPLGVFHPVEGNVRERALVPWSPELTVDGVPPLGVSVVRAGRTIGSDDVDWVVIGEHRAEPVEASPELVGTPCVTCGAPLEGTIIQCVCGGAFHLESEENDDPLRCGVALPSCPRCRAPMSLAPTYTPDPARLGIVPGGWGMR